jgi:DNA-binding beta-propeller fold protein YncE
MVLAGSGTIGTANGNGTAASFYSPAGITLCNGFLYVTDNTSIRRISVTSPYAVTDLVTGLTLYPQHPCTDGSNLYFTMGHCVYKTAVSGGAVTLLAGIPTTSGNQDGIASAATFFYPAGIAVSPGNRLYVADYTNNAVREIR